MQNSNKHYTDGHRKSKQKFPSASFPGDGLVETDVLFGRSCPGIVALHAFLDKPIKAGIVEVAGRGDEAVHVGRRVGVIEDKARRGIAEADILDRVVEAADVADDRDRAIAHGDHLAGAAGLEVGRHEEEVAGGIEKVRQVLVIALDEVDLRMLEGIGQDLVFHVARTDDDEAGIRFLQLAHAGNEPIDALLSGKAGDAGIQGTAEGSGHAKIVEDLLPVGPLSDLVVIEGVVLGQLVVRRRIPDIDVQAIDDADEVVVPAPVEDRPDTAKAIVVVEQFLAVGAADGSDLVRRHDAGLQVVEGIAHADKAGIEAVRMEIEIAAKIVP